jgi:sugar lactone lactonase YvrE
MGRHAEGSLPGGFDREPFRGRDGVTIGSLRGFARPFSVGFDAEGRLLVADMDRNCVDRFDASLAWDATLGGSQPGWHREAGRGSGDPLLAGPHSTVQDPEGLLYVTEYAGRRVSVFDPEGRLVRRIGEGSRGPALAGPATAEIGPDGCLLVVDYQASAVLRFDLLGRFTGCLGRRADGEPATGFGPAAKTVESGALGGLRRPHMARWGPDGRLYVADTWNHRIQRYEPEGSFSGWLGATAQGPTAGWASDGNSVSSPAPGGLDAPVAMAFADDGSLVVTEWGNHRVQLFSRDGECLGWLGGSDDADALGEWRLHGVPREGTALGSFSRPYDACRRGDALYVADTHNHRIQVVRGSAR